MLNERTFRLCTKKIDESIEFKKKVIQLLSYSDLGNITDTSIEKKEILDDVMGLLTPELQQIIAKRGNKPVTRELSLVHHYKNDYFLPIEKESAGTKKIMELSVPLIEISQGSSICLIDEIESSLHQGLFKKTKLANFKFILTIKVLSTNCY